MTRPSSHPTRTSDEPGRATALVITPTHDAQVVRGDDGMDHVEYGLLVVSVFDEPVTMSSVVVLDPRRRGTAANRGGCACRHDADPVRQEAVGGRSPVGSRRDQRRRDRPAGQRSDRVSHRIFTPRTDSKSGAMIDVPEIDGPEVAIDDAGDRDRAALKGDRWVATTACCKPNVHRDLRIAVDGRRIATPETFAVPTGPSGRRATSSYDGDGSQNEQFGAYGQEVSRSPIGPSSFPPRTASRREAGTKRRQRRISDFGGNQVMLQIEPNVSARDAAHLQPGSLVVEVGGEGGGRDAPCQARQHRALPGALTSTFGLDVNSSGRHGRSPPLRSVLGRYTLVTAPSISQPPKGTIW